MITDKTTTTSSSQLLTSNTASAGALDSEEAVNPLDQLSSVDVAVNVARLAQLDEATSVVNKADTVNAGNAVTPADDRIIAKPQVIAPGLKSNKDIQTYVTKPGDTISTVADRFGVTTNTIRYSNGLETEVIEKGTTLLISPVNGLVYRVQEGDSPKSLAEKYDTNEDLIIAFNDVDAKGKLKKGELIVIPEGIHPDSVGTAEPRNGGYGTDDGSASASSYGFSYGGGPLYSGNGYDYGYCTWWASLRRSQTGNPIPSNLGNASSWRSLAAAAGHAVGTTPRAGAVIWFPPNDYYGHVGYVEKVNPDGSIQISEMNFAGWARVSNRTFSASEARNYSYIY